MRVAVITGGRGQDASYLAELLLANNYKVISFVRRVSLPDNSNISYILNDENFILEDGDVTDFGSIARIITTYKPDEFYNLAAQSFVAASWAQPLATGDVNFQGVIVCLEAIRIFSPSTKFFQASTSEVYGDTPHVVQNENTPACPRSPYAAAKYGAESIVKVYRDSYNLFACYARSFNHESPRRGVEFVTRKITKWIGESCNVVSKHFKLVNEDSFAKSLTHKYIPPLALGNLDARRDWSHAKDVVRGMWLMLQQDTPEDFVLASGKAHSVEEFVQLAFIEIGIENWQRFVRIDQKHIRPAEVDVLCGDASKAVEKLGWRTTITLKELIAEMVSHDRQTK